MDVQFGDNVCGTQLSQWGALKQKKEFWMNIPQNGKILGLIFLILHQKRGNFLCLSLSGSKINIFLYSLRKRLSVGTVHFFYLAPTRLNTSLLKMYPQRKHHRKVIACIDFDLNLIHNVLFLSYGYLRLKISRKSYWENFLDFFEIINRSMSKLQKKWLTKKLVI